MSTNLANFVKKKEYLICVDSDGCDRCISYGCHDGQNEESRYASAFY